ncbi:MAG: AtpZ/AtpI family protein [Candidatus Omnitrophica bacterium]|nr:AtpZ/AtpI family protein [Candidatus Omnitrophota bacterium]MBI2174041.1 AtpZ/AtpI family protein [Candidatus Omnitrophota bacterium]MBI3009874.1 AtpZ/AtpI family protein [Candidatus Omnitrophota bacterium]
MRGQDARKAPPRTYSRRTRWPKPVGDHLYIPMLLALGPTVGSLFGWFLDHLLGTTPWLTLALLGAGFIAAAREIWMYVKERSDSDESN